VFVAAVGSSSNHACAMCPIVATVRDVRVPVADVGGSNNRVSVMCPRVAMGETHPLLLGHHSSDGTVAAGRLPITTETYCSSITPSLGLEPMCAL
jgi:hypothetical protein